MKRFLGFLLGVLVLAGCSQSGLDSTQIKLSSSFVFSDNLMATFQQSTDAKDVGRKLTFVGLKSSSNPKVVFEGTGEFPFLKRFEDDEKVVLQSPAIQSGKIDMFVIRKSDGSFSRAWSGDFVGIYAGASLGACL